MPHDNDALEQFADLAAVPAIRAAADAFLRDLQRFPIGGALLATARVLAPGDGSIVVAWERDERELEVTFEDATEGLFSYFNQETEFLSVGGVRAGRIPEQFLRLAANVVG